jgi:tetratricopeptide (TPR) repeat protein
LVAADLTRGNLGEAKKLLEESIPRYQAVEDKSGVALSLNNLGDLSRQEGNLQAAETTYQQAKATAQEIDDKDAIAYVLNGLGDVLTDRGDLPLLARRMKNHWPLETMPAKSKRQRKPRFPWLTSPSKKVTQLMPKRRCEKSRNSSIGNRQSTTNWLPASC